MEAQRAYDEGFQLKANGRFADALVPGERSLRLREAALGAWHPVVEKSLTLVGSLYRKRGDYVRAEQYLLRALAIQQAASGGTELRSGYRARPARRPVCRQGRLRPSHEGV
ncbi:tetratricopeptide repeat protein [Melittangium boletus]|uniref:tetratricopeptide repeat protein n=1 Tax=Melittangium boletus TaxID=83453 RepID=UPI003DA5B403